MDRAPDRHAALPAPPPPPTLVKATKVHKICFRGDSRSPGPEYTRAPYDNEGDIFRTGFQPELGKPSVPEYAAEPGAAGDIRTGGVCVTSNFYVAPTFPLLGRPGTWIYAVFIEQAYLTHTRQVMDALAAIKELRERRQAEFRSAASRDLASRGAADPPVLAQAAAADVMWSLYGDELAVESIPRTHVIAAVRCTRVNYADIRNMGDKTRLWDHGIQFELEAPVIQNRWCRLPDPIRAAAIRFLEGAVLANRREAEARTRSLYNVTPTRDTGFKRSTGAP